MKVIISFWLWVLCLGTCYGQKPALALETYKSWTEVNLGGISPDARYAYYYINSKAMSSDNNSEFILKTTSGKSLYSVSGLTSPTISNDSKYLYGTLPGDSLLIYDFNGNRNYFVPNVKGYELIDVKGTTHLLLKSRQAIKLCDLSGRILKQFENVSQYKFSPSGESLILLKSDPGAKERVAAWFVDMTSNKNKQIFSGPNVSNVIFDNIGSQAAFVVNEANANSLWYYKVGSDQAVLLADQHNDGIDNTMSIVTGEYWRFSKDGERLFFSLKTNGGKQTDTNKPSDLETWSYEDAYLKSFYNGMVGMQMLQNRNYLSAINLSNRTVLQLINCEERLVSGSLRYETDSIFIILSTKALNTERWNKNSRLSFYICNTKTGKRSSLELDRTHWISPTLSPTGRYIIYFDPALKSYVSYQTATKTKKAITDKIKVGFGYYYNRHYPNQEEATTGITGWLKNDNALLINTMYDIYRVDPAGNTDPINVTQGLGEKEKIVFYLAGQPTGGTVDEDKILFGAFHTKTKQYGFYEYHANTKGQKLKELYKGSRYSGHLDYVYYQLRDDDFLTAKNGKGYLVKWQQANKSPNYYFSKDLISFNQLSHLNPESKYNWLSSELCSYTDSLGNQYQGILYKPENFDPNKKYPVVFRIYETQSNSLNAYIQPGPVGANFNIALLVSNGYLVFLPDIRGIIGAPGEGALRSVLAAANHVGQYSFVDKDKFALVGHSFGGFETNYVMTHCNRFSAAISGAGVSDMTRLATSIWFPGQSQQSFTQHSYFMMEKTVVENPQAYVRNSPLYEAKNVNAPILFMHNDGDENVDFRQTQAFYLVLRSLAKPCWWLNYKGHGHGVGGEKNQLDYNKKVWQFLDHYLKGAPMPQWMKEHI
ncbi:alpha/beta hydrolase family protein [Pedobacter faecalis]|uniref:alpha/beta hydrolase family protein n=1 Tax=Pedobacter faecalis TaxID=3041495 RepID=UPI00254D8FED|nr:prolyl oligopeptidase family serine peptidase [Pedobacter sp. ELA7]